MHADSNDALYVKINGVFKLIAPLQWIQSPKFFWVAYAAFSILWLMHPFYELVFL